jgi:DNA polymerase II small subunit/DNA polymerase delta subunit B
MNHKHVRNLINLGYLVDESVVNIIENIDENDFFKLLDFLKKENPLVIDNELIKKIFVRDVEIIKEFAPASRFTVQDFVKKLNEKYNVLQAILVKRVDFSDLVSINKIGSGDASIIALVKDKVEKEGNFLVNLEDPTGEIQALIPRSLGEKLSLDDVVAVSGRINNKVLLVEKLIYPDVPIRPVNYTSDSVKVAFLGKERDCDANYVFYVDEINDKIKDKKYKIKVPCFVEIGGVMVLVVSGLNPLDVLRKRYASIKSTDFIIEHVPDIIFTDEDFNTNYKGITIVSLNKLIDLKNREVSSI